MARPASDLERPIFFIGMPRGGTTIMFAGFAANRALGWFSQYMERFPSVPGIAALNRMTTILPGTRKAVARRGEARPLRSRSQIAPVEAYGIWSRCCGEEFIDGYLLGVTATPPQRRCMRRRVRRTLLLQGKPRFAAKLTGPGRIGYLTSIFPEACFVNVVRDPRAVVESLMRVPFWRETSRYREPAWHGGLAEDDLQALKTSANPEALAAVQWRAVLRTTREEAARIARGRYTEAKYEDFIADPHRTLSALFDFAGLSDDPTAHGFLDDRLGLRDLSQGWRERLSEERIGEIEGLLEQPMRELGYTRITAA